MDLMTFAAETDSSGRRQFISCHPEKMWSVVEAVKRDRRHFYEVIALGNPSKLYFDVEYSRRENPEMRGVEEKHLEEFLRHVAHREDNGIAKIRVLLHYNIVQCHPKVFSH
jgi:hypothetical protein